MADDISQDRQAAARRDAYLREMERKSLDTIMVFNPTDKDYLLEWDKHYHRVPNSGKDMGFGKGKMELSRYLAEKYAREMKNLIINEAEADFIRTFKGEQEKTGHKFRDKWEENEAALPLAPKTSDPERIKEIYSVIVLGVVREYGMDQPEVPTGELIDTKTPEERALENLEKPYVATGEPQQQEPALTSSTTASLPTDTTTTYTDMPTKTVSTPSKPYKTVSTWVPINKRKTKAAVQEISK